MSERGAKQERKRARDGRRPDSRIRLLLGKRRLWVGAGTLALASVVAVGIVVSRGTGPVEPIVERSGPTVSLSGTDPITGRRVSLDDYSGTPVVITVWGLLSLE